jgi:dihydrofolate reductase
MPITASVYIATSLDGFISRPDGDIDWLNRANALVPPGEDCGYAKFMETVDVLVMGRNTYEQVVTFEPWPYTGREVVVLSTQTVTVPEHLRASVVTSSETPAALLARLASRGVQHVYVDGGKTVQRFLADGLIHELTITVIPVLLGSGRPLFSSASREQRLELLSSRAYEFGFVQSTYRVIADSRDDT